MVALEILLIGLLVMLIMVGVLLLFSGLYSLLPPVIALVPLLALVGSFVLGAIELLLLFGASEDKRVAKRDLRYLGATFVISGVLFWLSTLLLNRI
jgi:uncharacterized membrane protein HdeD (DUF308 family)